MGEVSGVYIALVGIQDLDVSDESDCPPSESIQTYHIMSSLEMEKIISSKTLTYIYMTAHCNSPQHPCYIC